jgi:glucose 1-dehydrogenase
MKRCQDKVALVTGAARGMGRGIALSLASEGADVVINDIASPQAAQEVLDAIAQIGQKAFYWQIDVADREQVVRLVGNVLDHFGKLDICVANAGISIPEYVIAAQWEHVLRTIQVTQFGVFHTCQVAAQQMVRQVEQGMAGGKIVIIGSVHEELAVRGSAAYNMSKAAITQLGRTMAVELAPYHINVNVIHPGLTDTPGTRTVISAEVLQRASKRIPWGRLGTPEDVGKAVTFLASDDADYITGISLRVDGGFKLGPRFPLDD